MGRIFGKLASEFEQSPEDLATEGFRHLLSHRVAGSAFINYVNGQCGTDLDPSMTFRSQRETDKGEGQPDLKGVEGDGSTSLLIESKFWAGLSTHQPNGYLRQLSDSSGGALLFLVPHPRRSSFWPKVRDKALDQWTPINGSPSTDANSPHEAPEDEHILRLENDTTMLLRSWDDVLNAVTAGVQSEGGYQDLLEDIRQVKSLCDRFSESGFLPLRGEEIGQNIGKRVRQLHNLVQDLRGHLGKGWSSKTRMATSRKRYTFTTKLHDHDAVIGVKYIWWARDGRSPLWLRIKAGNADKRDDVLRAVEPDIQAFADKPTTYPNDVLFPLPVRLGVERPEVIDGLVQHLRQIADRLAPVLGDS
jgi:hypothetical protein